MTGPDAYMEASSDWRRARPSVGVSPPGWGSEYPSEFETPDGVARTFSLWGSKLYQKIIDTLGRLDELEVSGALNAL